jgi:ketosteroid isomerase-like protein
MVVSMAAALGVTGVVHGQGKTDPTLNKLAAEFEAAFNAKDAAKIASFYAEDGVAMPPIAQWSRGAAPSRHS